MEIIFRRFQLIDKEKEKALMSLIKQKGLTRDDLMLILKSLRIQIDSETD